MPGDKTPHWGQFLGMGFETAIGVGVGYFVGHWLGRKYNWDPWATVIGAMIGMIAGVYLLLKEVNRMDKDG
jgi:F0F1-type ATP synthase assembly protein I